MLKDLIAAHQDRRAEDLLITTLAVLSLRGHEILRTTDKSFHHSFSKALEVFRNSGGELAELAASYHQDVVSNTFDQLDHALIAAEQLGWVKFPNPSYSRLQITMSPVDAERLLEEWSGQEEAFETAAAKLLAADA